MGRIQCEFLVKAVGPLKYYLGNIYHLDDKTKMWNIGHQKHSYIDEALHKIEEVHGTI